MKEAELAAAYARAYNNWVIDFCSTDPHRLIPVAHISLLDINEAVKEIQRVAQLGVKGAFMRAAPPSQIPYWDRAYDPFWAALQAVGMPIGVHVALNEYFLGHQWKMTESVTAVCNTNTPLTRNDVGNMRLVAHTPSRVSLHSPPGRGL